MKPLSIEKGGYRPTLPGPSLPPTVHSYAELIAYARDGPAVVMVAKDDMLKLLLKLEQFENPSLQGIPMTTIWCLFHIEIDYDPPNNNLIAWWPNKPSVEVLCKAMGVELAGGKDQEIVAAVRVFSGEETLLAEHNARYRLREIPPGCVNAP